MLESINNMDLSDAGLSTAVVPICMLAPGRFSTTTVCLSLSCRWWALSFQVTGVSMRRVILESPYNGDTDGNVTYPRACVRDSLLRGEAPIASHLLYTQLGVLRDDVTREREQGIAAGLAWGPVADATVDKGISPGMKRGIADAEAAERPVEYRVLEESTPKRD